jgi:hypothetical protein
MKMRQQQYPGLFFRELKECGTIKVKEFANVALGAFNFTVYLVGWKVHKAGRQIGDQTFEPEALLQHLISNFLLCDIPSSSIDQTAVRICTPFKPTIRTVFAPVAVFERGHFLLGRQGGDRLASPVPIVRVNEIEESLR